MENTEHISPQNLQIQGIFDKYLNSRSTAASSQISQDSHLDDDLLSAFIEGNLNQRESATTLSHLVECSFCRHVTAELIKLDYAFADNAKNTVIAQTSEPAKISEVLNGLLSRLFGNNEAAVFAHEEKEEDSESTGEKPSKEE